MKLLKLEHKENKIRLNILGIKISYKRNCIYRYDLGKNLSGGLDPLGDVFYKNNHIYRAIKKDKVAYFKQLSEKGIFKKLISENIFINFKISRYYNNKYPIILKVKTLPNITPNFWSPQMIKEAGKTILKVEQLLQTKGFHLIDAHPWNVLFENNCPKFIDFGSIIDAGKGSDFKNEFLRGVILPLVLWHNGNSFWAQKQLFSAFNFYQRTNPKTDVLKTPMWLDSLKVFEQELNEHQKQVWKKLYYDKELRPEYLDVLFSSQKSFWAEYQDFLLQNDTQNVRMKRFFRIEELIKRYASGATSVVDLAGNNGGMCYLLSSDKKYKKLYSLDFEAGVIDHAFQFHSTHNSRVNLLLQNFMLPTDPNIFDIIKSDIVLAMAVTHHLILGQKLSIDFIFSQIKKYANKYVFIEFMPLGLWGGEEILPKIPEWYNEHWFEKNFKKYFSLLHKEQLEKNRIIFVGKIK